MVAAILTLPVFILEMGSHLIPAMHHWVMGVLGEQTSWYIQFALATVVLFGPGLRFFRKGVPALLRGAPDMNSLVSVGTAAAYGYSVVATFVPEVLPQRTANVYFEAAAVIVTLILLGRALEAAEQFWTHTGDRYEQRRHDLERPLLPPDALYLSPDALRERLNQGERIEVCGEGHPQRERAHVLASQPAPDLPITARDHVPAEALKSFLASYPGRVLVAADSLGATHRMLDLAVAGPGGVLVLGRRGPGFQPLAVEGAPASASSAPTTRLPSSTSCLRRWTTPSSCGPGTEGRSRSAAGARSGG